MVRYLDEHWQYQMQVKYDFNNMMSRFAGEGEGLQEADIQAMAAGVSAVHQRLAEKRARGEMYWRELPLNQEAVVPEILNLADEIVERFDNFVVLGIGGSALGPIAVQQALNHLYYNELPRDRRSGPRFYVLDNVDPERINALAAVIDPAKTLFNVITKSGSTSETMAQFMVVTRWLKQTLGDKVAGNIVATTDQEQGNLIKIARAEGYRVLIIPRGVGGRFSELCPVGLLPAAVCGINIKELLAGAAYMDKLCREPDVHCNPAYMAGLLQYLAMARGKNVSVMMPYADSLKYFADWYAQLWAESLGKRYDRQGREVFTGQTPVKALGTTDQHSQVQLYTEGPFDKVVTFIEVGKYRSDVAIPRLFEEIPDLSFLGGHTMAELIKAEKLATEYALVKAGRLNNTILLPEVNPFTVGQLICLLEVETAFVGELLEINAFDQPGVEEGKNATYALLGRPGYEAKKRELVSRPVKDRRFVI